MYKVYIGICIDMYLYRYLSIYIYMYIYIYIPTHPHTSALCEVSGASRVERKKGLNLPPL